MGRIGPIGIWELLIILALVLLIFGPRRLPEMAKGLGQAVREFRKGIRDMKQDFEDEADERPKGAPVAAATTAGPAASGPAGVGVTDPAEPATSAQGNGAGQA